MTQGFFQFNNSIIDEIINFATSSFDLLFLSGQKGSSKSETIEKVLPTLEESSLVFQHFCFSNTVIDDFLLNFYDVLRNFTLAQKISLKKFTSDNFKEKVSHYFKAIETDCLIIVENFEKVEDNVEIVDFLSHLATYQNVKIIILTRNSEKNLFRFKKIRMQNIEINELDKEEFKSKLTVLSSPVNEVVKEKFYEITHGLDLYLQMSVKYCATANTTIEDLIDEFERKSLNNYLSFEEFMVMKFVSIVPVVYKGFLKTLCALSHPVSIQFLESYKLGNVSYIDYLSNNYLISFFKNQIYVKDYFRQYIINSFSIQEKVTYYKNFIEIYENELTKSPKDRLLRLSRESIRKEIEYLKSLIPSINSPSKSQKVFSYLGISTQNWSNEKDIQKSKLSEKLQKIKDRKNALLKEGSQKENKLFNDEEEKIKRFIIDLINSSRDYMKKYQYNEAIQELLRALEMDIENEFEIEILILLAKNYEHLHQFDFSRKYYQNALVLAQETNDTRKCEIEFLIALTEKNLFNIESAKEKFKAIINNVDNSQNYIARASLELGEIEEANSNFNEALVCYENALDLSIGKNKALACKSYYKLAVLYDENQDWENAVKYYQKNYITSSERKENKYYSVSLTNLALIFIEQARYKEACEYLKLALLHDSEINDYENMYFSQKELAKLYSRFDELSAIGYFKQALDSAKKLNDVFKEALIHFEMGEFYYDKQEDEKALVNFLNAKQVLKNTTDKENINRVNSRVEDIKMRLSENSFNLIMGKYAFRE